MKSKAKRNDVELVVPGLNKKRSFEINHAERLLRMPNNGGWQLPEDSELEFDLSNGIRRKQNQRDSTGTKE